MFTKELFMMNLGTGTDLIAFSSEAFGSDSLRTTSLMKDFVHDRRVYFIERPVLTSAAGSSYYIEVSEHKISIVRPYLCEETSVFDQKKAVLELLKDLIVDEHISHYSMWTDTPTAMHFIRNLSPEIIVYDCLRDYGLSHGELEKELLQYADFVHTADMKDPITTGPMRFVKPIQFKDTIY
jgi:hypothetical protein